MQLVCALRRLLFVCASYLREPREQINDNIDTLFMALFFDKQWGFSGFIRYAFVYRTIHYIMIAGVSYVFLDLYFGPTNRAVPVRRPVLDWSSWMSTCKFEKRKVSTTFDRASERAKTFDLFLIKITPVRQFSLSLYLYTYSESCEQTRTVGIGSCLCFLPNLATPSWAIQHGVPKLQPCAVNKLQ